MMSAVFVTALLAAAIAIPNRASTPPAPQVASTIPAADAIIAPGRIRLSVTYDRPMRPQSYSVVQKSMETYPECGTNRPTLSADRRTFTLICDVRPDHHYEIWFNSPPYMNFVDDGGVAAKPFGLRFRTYKAVTADR